MLQRRVSQDSFTTSRDLRYSGQISSTPGALPPRSCLTTSVTSAWVTDESTSESSASSSSTEAIRVIGQDVIVAQGTDAQLFCQLVETTKTVTSVTWQRRTKEKPTDTDLFTITLNGKVERAEELKDRVTFTGNILALNGSMLLRNITVSDEGIYTCIFSVFGSGLSTKEIHLTVQVPPIVNVGTDVAAVAGDSEKIIATCTAANAKPAAEVSWSLGVLNDCLEVKTVIVDSEGRYTVNSSLIGNATKNLNQKKVQCLVKHPGLKEKLELNYTLNIHYPPQLVYIILAGDHKETRKFQCEADANPKPTIFTWSRHFPVKEPLSTGINGIQNIQLSPDSNGFYYCVVSNQHGDAVGSLNVYVEPQSKIFLVLLIPLIAVGVCLFIWKLIPILRRKKGIPVPTESSELEETNQCASGSILSTGTIP